MALRTGESGVGQSWMRRRANTSLGASMTQTSACESGSARGARPVPSSNQTRASKVAMTQCYAPLVGATPRTRPTFSRSSTSKTGRGPTGGMLPTTADRSSRANDRVRDLDLLPQCRVGHACGRPAPASSRGRLPTNSEKQVDQPWTDRTERLGAAERGASAGWPR